MELKFDRDKIRSLSSEISIALERLQGLSEMSKQDFLNDPYKIASAKYFLIVTIEGAIDLCNHVISKNRFRAPEDYADTFRVIGEKSTFPKDFVDKLIEMARFRNRLVHIYWNVDDELLYNILQEDIKDIEEFLDRFTDFLNQQYT
ncbi:MAG: type VII toxin-antitoxin system HepT family RNase toxin [Atribacterota bacterium]